MKPLKFLILAAAPLLLLASCRSKELTRMGFDKVESFRMESLRFGSAEGTAAVSLYNGNKKSVTFGSARFEVRWGERVLGVITLLQPVTVLPGYSRVGMPVRIRFPQDGLKVVMEMLLRKGESRGRRHQLRIAGMLGIDRGGSMQTVRFNRRVSAKALESLGRHLIDPIEFKLLR